MGRSWHLGCPSGSKGIASESADYENPAIVQSVFIAVIYSGDLKLDFSESRYDTECRQTLYRSLDGGYFILALRFGHARTIRRLYDFWHMWCILWSLTIRLYRLSIMSTSWVGVSVSFITAVLR
jgi:hypothetical protein